MAAVISSNLQHMRYQCVGGGPFDGREHELWDGCIGLSVPELVDESTGQPMALRGAVRVAANDSYSHGVLRLHHYDLDRGVLRYRGLR